MSIETFLLCVVIALLTCISYYAWKTSDNDNKANYNAFQVGRSLLVIVIFAQLGYTCAKSLYELIMSIFG
jgi:hypothetical protein